MKRFKRICTGGPYGDETSSYDIILPKEMTIEEFIEVVITDEPDEWGEITCGRRLLAEYSHGEATFGPYYDSHKHYKIASVTAHGGWSLMNYDILVYRPTQKPDWSKYKPQQISIFDF